MSENILHPDPDTDGLRKRKRRALSNDSVGESEGDETQDKGKKPLGRTPDGLSEQFSSLLERLGRTTNSGPSVRGSRDS